MSDPRDHFLCRGWVVGLRHDQIASLLSEIDWRRGEFVVSYEKSPTDSPPIVCLYNSGHCDWCTKTAANLTCPFCQDADAPRMTSPLSQAPKHGFEIPGDPLDLGGWRGTRTVRCKDGLDHLVGLYVGW